MSGEPSDPVRLETERFLLKSLGAEDATERYLSWLRDPEVTRYLNCRFGEHDLEALREFILAHDDEHSFLVGIFLRESGEHIGNYEAVCHPNHLHCHLGVLVGERGYWGAGTVTETREAMLDFLFTEVGMLKVCGECYAANTAAVFNYKAQGFTAEGVLRSHVVCGGGRSDVIRFAMFSENWLERHRS